MAKVILECAAHRLLATEPPRRPRWPRSRRPDQRAECLTRGCPTGSIPKATLEGEYLRRLEHLRAEPKYLALFREIVLRAWRDRHVHVAEKRRVLQGRLDDLRARKDKLVEAYLDDGSARVAHRGHVRRDRHRGGAWPSPSKSWATPARCGARCPWRRRSACSRPSFRKVWPSTAEVIEPP